MKTKNVLRFYNIFSFSLNQVIFLLFYYAFVYFYCMKCNIVDNFKSFSKNVADSIVTQSCINFMYLPVPK